MNKALLLLVFAISYATGGSAQVRGATLKVNDFIIVRNEYKFNCDVEFTNAYNSNYDHYLVFFLKQRTGLLKMVLVNQNDFQQNAFLLSGQLLGIPIELLPTAAFVLQGFTLYTILLEGNIHDFINVSNIIQQEFRDNLTDINSVLNIFYKFGHKPLSYVETQR